MNQAEAPPAANGRSLCKGCNDGLIHLGNSLRASWEAAIYVVVPLAKGWPFTARHA
ncbi:MAG: hypothetical protein HOM55_06485 [Proteobacteria bacterium]|nr:hypothetical protein [Pseudomonadota bacterium]